MCTCALFCLFVKFPISVKIHLNRLRSFLNHRIMFNHVGIKSHIFYTIFSLLFFEILSIGTLNAQSIKPGINFQAIARDNGFNPANNRTIYVQSTIETSNGVVVFGEKHKTATNEFGVFNIAIGKGERVIGASDLYSIDWTVSNYNIHLKVAIIPVLPNYNWDYEKEWIDLGSVSFGIVPYAIQSLSAIPSVIDTSFLKSKLNLTDTAKMLLPYGKLFATSDTILKRLDNVIHIADSNLYVTHYGFSQKTFDTSTIYAQILQRVKNTDTALMLSHYAQKSLLTNQLSNKINVSDTAQMLANYISTSLFNQQLGIKLASSDTAAMLTNRIGRDTISLSNRINTKLNSMDTANLSFRINQNELITNKTIDVAAVANYNDDNYPSVKAIKDYVDASIIAGATSYNFTNPGTAGLTPNWVSSGSAHTLNIPLASASAVTGGLISKLDYDHFTSAYTTNINALTISGTSGSASLSGQNLTIPNYTLLGLTGNVHANHLYAGPTTGAMDLANFRALVAEDIPNNSANTLGNAGTATKLSTARYINNALFDGSANVLNITANTPYDVTFTNDGLGVASGSIFNGSSAKSISYNTIGAAPLMGANTITTLGTISNGTWAANIIGANYGGAGSNNGILKADGYGVVTAAIGGTDFQSPLSFSSPLINTSNTISIQQATGVYSGYLSNTDWTVFNNKIDASQKAVQNGIASLDANGKVPTSQIPAISFSSGYVVSSEAAMLALSNAVVGSIAIRSDNNQNYVLSASDPAVLSNWLRLLMPVSVSSVNNHTESVITLTSSDIGEGTNLYYTNARAKAAIGAVGPVAYAPSTGLISMSAASGTTAGYLSASDFNTFNNKLAVFPAQSANTFYAGPSSGAIASPSFRLISASDIPTLNQNTTGTAAAANKLTNTKNINNTPFDGSSDITITSLTPNTIKFDNSGLGALSTATFNGSASMTVSYNTIGAAPLAGSSSITTLGTITVGTWSGTVIDASHGGAGNITGILKSNGTGLVSAAAAGTDFENVLSFSAPLTRAANTISISSNPTFTSIVAGTLTATTANLTSVNTSSINASTINVSGDIAAKRFKLTMPTAITAATSTSIDLSTGNVFTVNMGLNVTTLNVTNPVVGTYLIKFVQDATGTRDVTFPVSWKWAGGAAPNLTNTPNKTDIVTLIYDGSIYYATIVQNF